MLAKLYNLLRAAHGFARIGASVLAGTMVVASAGYVGERLLSAPSAPAPGEGEEAPLEAFSPATSPSPARFPASPPLAVRQVGRGPGSSSREDSAALVSGVEASSAGSSSQPVFDGGTTPAPPDNLPALDAANGGMAEAIDARASTSAGTSTATSTSSSLASPADSGAYFARGGATSSATATATASVSINGTLYWDYEHRWDNDTWW